MPKNKSKEKDKKLEEENEYCDCHTHHGECDCHEHHDECDCSDDQCDCGCDCGCGDYDEEEINLIGEYLNAAKQIQADFDNYRKRNEKAIEDAKEYGKAGVITSILPCIDAIDKAVDMTTDTNTLKGLQMVQNKFVEVLGNLGVTKIESKGKKFDVNLHNVISAVQSDAESGTILEDAESGYMLGDKIIRFAQVIIAK